jgi:hypothetical protein
MWVRQARLSFSGPGRAKFLAELRQRLPFEAIVAFCEGSDLFRLEVDNPLELTRRAETLFDLSASCRRLHARKCRFRSFFLKTASGLYESLARRIGSCMASTAVT